MHSHPMRQFRSTSFRFRFSEEFRSSRIPLATSMSERVVKSERNFVLPSGCAFIESSLLSRQRLTLTTLQSLNEASDHSFHSLVVCHGTNPPWRTWRVRRVGAEAV